MPGEVTQLLADLRGGSRLAADELFPLVLDELRREAASLLARERPSHTLQPTALVNEVYLRMVRCEAQEGDVSATPGTGHWQDRAHFLAVAAQAMRRILVDHARRRNRVKRGGPRRVDSRADDQSVKESASGSDRVPLDSSLLVKYETSAGVDMEALNAALTQLSSIRPRAAQIVDMRFFADMTVEEVACVLEVSVSTVEREWRFARAWLKDTLSEVDSPLVEKRDHDADKGGDGR
jgi:RNA polymerase sigma-70 factor, ECF subfamily